MIELMITLVISGILLTWGVSSWQNFMQDNRMSSQVNELLTEMMLARSESIRRRATVTICKSTNLTDCDGGGANWEVGWIVFVENINANTSVDAGETILRVHETLGGGNTLTAGAGVVNGVRYLSSGLAVLDPGGGLNSVFNLCDSRGLNSGRSISVSVAGRPSIGPAVNCPP